MEASNKLLGYVVLNSYLSNSGLRLKADELAGKISSSPIIINKLGEYFKLALDGDSSKLDRAMEDLANRAENKIPNADSFFAAMKTQMDSDFFYVAKFAIEKSSEDIGQAVTNTVKPLAWIASNFWLVALIAGGAYVYIKTRKVEG